MADKDASQQEIIIPGIDTVTGIARTGGTIAAYLQVLSMFNKDIKERLQLLRFFLFEISMAENTFPKKHLPSFITQLTALEGASVSLGAAETSTTAARLKEAGKAGDLSFICDNLSGFIDHLTKLQEHIHAALALKSGASAQESIDVGDPETASDAILLLFKKLAEALKAQDALEIERTLKELDNKPLDSKTSEAFEKISDQVLMTEFGSAIKSIDELLG